jgi:hypothetical protein
VATNRPKYPDYDKKNDNFTFETRTKQGRLVTISVFIDVKKTNYIYKTSVEDLIRHADGIVREVISFIYFSFNFILFIQYRFTDKGR